MALESTELFPGWNGYRIAGVCLLLHAVTSLLDFLVSMDLGEASPRGFVPVIFDAVIGGSLLTGSTQWLGWAIFRASIGAVLFSAVHAMRGDYAAVGLQVLASGGLLGLLIGRAGQARIVASIAAFGLYALGFFGLFALYYAFG